MLTKCEDVRVGRVGLETTTGGLLDPRMPSPALLADLCTSLKRRSGMASRPLSSLPGTRSSPDVCSPDVPRRAVAAMTAGPYETQRQAPEAPALRTPRAAWDAAPGVAKMAPPNARRPRRR